MKDKKSPLKFSGLASGAYRAARVEGAGDIAASKAITKAAGSIAQTGLALTQYFGEVGRQYDEFVENVTNNGVMLTDENFEALYDDLQSGRNDFILGSKKSRTLAMKDLSELANSYEDYKGLVENTAILADSPDGLLDIFKNSPEGKAYLDAVSGRNKLMKNPSKSAQNKNELGVMLGDRWTSLSELKNIAGNNVKDTNFAGTIEALAIKQLQSKRKPNMKAINYSVSRMVQNGKTKSLVHSEIIPGRTFYNDVVSKLTTNSYADLGLNDVTLNKYADASDVNWKDGINNEEAQLIANTMINDTMYTNQLQAELIDYYSNYAAQQNPQYVTPIVGIGRGTASTVQDQYQFIMNNPNLTDEEKTDAIIDLQVGQTEMQNEDEFAD